MITSLSASSVRWLPHLARVDRMGLPYEAEPMILSALKIVHGCDLRSPMHGDRKTGVG